MKILSIGNSFSEDAQRYLHKLAKKAGEDITTANLFIGGCSLCSHFINAWENYPSYDLHVNGEFVKNRVSIKELLLSEDWDIITLQQASHYSARYETYTPYIERVAQYVRAHCPRAKIYVHQTWAYAEGSSRLTYIGGFATEQEMFEGIRDACQRSAEAIQADGIIPCGKAMLLSTRMGIDKIHRDTFHASLGAGRYLLALTWYKAVTGKDISGDSFDEFDEPVTAEERAAVIKAVNAAFED